MRFLFSNLSLQFCQFCGCDIPSCKNHHQASSRPAGCHLGGKYLRIVHNLQYLLQINTGCRINATQSTLWAVGTIWEHSLHSRRLSIRAKKTGFNGNCFRAGSQGEAGEPSQELIFQLSIKTKFLFLEKRVVSNGNHFHAIRFPILKLFCSYF